MRVGVVGAGLIGTKRVEAIRRLPGHDVVWIVDCDAARAEALAATCGARHASAWEAMVGDPQVDAVIVAIYHDHAPQVAVAALEAGKHVLCEKPLGRTAAEARAIVASARRARRCLKTGFNYRHYPGIAKAHRLVRDGAIGTLRYLRMLLGHGARPEYDKEWRVHPSLGGGGALLDPGVHCLDLLRWFVGEPRVASIYRMNAFWSTPFEDNVFVTFRCDDAVTATLQSSITEWRNQFRFEIMGTDGSIVVDGRGGSYGPQRLRHAPRWWWLQTPPAREIEETFPDGDASFTEETREFFAAIAEGREPLGSGVDGLRVAEIVDALYQAPNPFEVRFP